MPGGRRSFVSQERGGSFVGPGRGVRCGFPPPPPGRPGNRSRDRQIRPGRRGRSSGDCRRNFRAVIPPNQGVGRGSQSRRSKTGISGVGIEGGMEHSDHNENEYYNTRTRMASARPKSRGCPLNDPSFWCGRWWKFLRQRGKPGVFRSTNWPGCRASAPRESRLSNRGKTPPPCAISAGSPMLWEFRFPGSLPTPTGRLHGRGPEIKFRVPIAGRAGSG